MKFHLGYEITLPSVPVDVAFDRLTSAAHVEQVVRLSDLVSDFELLSSEGATAHYRFVENISMGYGLIKKSLSIVVKQTRDINNKSLLYESNVDQGTVTIVKKRSFKPTNDGGTIVTETVDGECPALYQPFTKQQGQKALMEHMNKYHTLFDKM